MKVEKWRILPHYSYDKEIRVLTHFGDEVIVDNDDTRNGPKIAKLIVKAVNDSLKESA